MMYLGGVTLGYFKLYPMGFQPKDERPVSAENQSRSADSVPPAGSSAQEGTRRPLQWPLHGFI